MPNERDAKSTTQFNQFEALPASRGKPSLHVTLGVVAPPMPAHWFPAVALHIANATLRSGKSDLSDKFRRTFDE